MRNLKKILALALVFAMAFTFVASAADFTDAAEIGANYLDDVNMLVELGVIAGYPDGSFGPAKNITRAEFAKMAYTIKYGSDTEFTAQAIAAVSLIRHERGITLEELAEKLTVSYSKVAQLTGALEMDGFICVDLLQRCSIGKNIQ